MDPTLVAFRTGRFQTCPCFRLCTDFARPVYLPFATRPLLNASRIPKSANDAFRVERSFLFAHVYETETSEFQCPDKPRLAAVSPHWQNDGAFNWFTIPLAEAR